MIPSSHQPQPAHRAWRLLGAAGISSYGDWLSVVAISVLLFRLTHQAEIPALYILVKVAPRMLGSTGGGWLTDRWGPSLVVGWCAMVQGVCTGVIVLLAATGNIWPIFLAVGLAQFLGAMAQPGYSASIPRVTAPDGLARVNAIYSGLFESSVLVAPALGALLLGVVRPEVLIGADAISFLVAGLLMFSLGVHKVSKVTETQAITIKPRQIIWNDPMIRGLAAGFFCSAVIITVLQAVLVVAAAQRFSQDSSVGWLYAAVGAGGVAGSLLLLRWHPTRITRRGITSGALMEILPLGLFAWVGNIWLGLIILAVSTGAGALYQTRGQIAIQELVPAEALGRVNGLLRLFLYSGMLAGAVMAVGLVNWLGWSLLVEGTAVLMALLFLLTVYGSRVSEKFQSVRLVAETSPGEFSESNLRPH